MKTLIDLADWAGTIPTILQIVLGILVILAALAAFFMVRKVYRYLKARPVEDTLTVVAAGIATGVSAQGMWKFAGDVLGFDGPLRFLLFAFIEVAVITSAVRARRNMRENFSAGIDGVAVWVLTCLTAVLSSMDAGSFAEAVFRLAAPLVAAWLWERGMAIERHRATGRKRINWRVTPERVLVRIGLAETSEITAGEVDARRRLTRVALAAKHALALKAAGAWGWRQQRALSQLSTAVDRAVQHTDLTRNEERQRDLLDQIGAMLAAAGLRDLAPIAPWASLDHPTLIPPRKPGNMPPAADAVKDALAQWNRETLRDPSILLPVLDASKFASTPATTSALAIPAVRRRILISPGDPRPVGTRAPFLTWTRPDARPLEGPRFLPPLDASLDAELDAGNDVDAEGTRPDGDQDADQKKPTEQDRNRVAKWWAKQVEKGEVLSKWTLATRAGFKPTWCDDRITEGKQILADKGWTFDERGRPVRPIEVDAELVASTPSVNGSEPSTSN